MSVCYSIFNRSFQECDAVIVTTSCAYESASLEAMKQGFFELQKKEVHILGPLLPPGYDIETQNTEEGISNDIEVFLKEMLVQHGKRSVSFVRSFPLFRFPTSYFILRVSFGTTCFDELIEALIEKKGLFVCDSCFPSNNLRFMLFNQILADASKNATLSERQMEKIKPSGLGMLATWSPQQFILNHPVLHLYFYLSQFDTQDSILHRQLDGSLRMEV